MKYYENLGAMVPDKLIAGNIIPIHTVSGTIVAGSGKLVRGTVLALSSGTAGTGKLSVLGATAANNETLTAYGILTDDVDATTETVAEVYVSGQFNKGALIVKDGYTLAAADINALRDGGIYIENKA